MSDVVSTGQGVFRVNLRGLVGPKGNWSNTVLHPVGIYEAQGELPELFMRAFLNAIGHSRSGRGRWNSWKKGAGLLRGWFLMWLG